MKISDRLRVLIKSSIPDPMSSENEFVLFLEDLVSTVDELSSVTPSTPTFPTTTEHNRPSTGTIDGGSW